MTSNRTSLVFSVAFAVFLLGPPLLPYQFGPYDLMTWGDVLDLATPLVLLPLYWLLLRGGAGMPSLWEVAAFLALAALWVEGQGMHLGANSIRRLLEDAGPGLTGLTHFYDEVLGHYFWHAGITGLAALAMFREWRGGASQGGLSLAALLPASVIYGAAFFMIVIEGGTWPLGLPFAAAAGLFGATYARGNLGGRPLISFFAGAHIVALALFAAWAIVQGGLPEFSEVGIID